MNIFIYFYFYYYLCFKRRKLGLSFIFLEVGFYFVYCLSVFCYRSYEIFNTPLTFNDFLLGFNEGYVTAIHRAVIIGFGFNLTYFNFKINFILFLNSFHGALNMMKFSVEIFLFYFLFLFIL